MFPNTEKEKGPMKPQGEVCNGSVGSKPSKMPDPAFPRGGFNYRNNYDPDDMGIDGHSNGLGPDIPRSGRFG